MLPISEKAITYMRTKNGRSFAVKLVVNGSDFPCDILKLKVKKGSCGSNFQPGCYYSTSIEVEIMSKQKLKNGDKIEVWKSVPLSGDSTFYKDATAYVRNPISKTQPDKTTKKITFVAEGAISFKLGKEWTGGIKETINDMLALFPVSISLQDGLDGSYSVNQSAEVKGLLQREILAHIASCFFGYVAEDVDGNIVIKTFNNNANDVIEFDEDRSSSSPDVYDTVTVQGIQVMTNTSEGQTDFVYPENAEMVNYSINNPLMTEELFNAYASRFVGFTYTPYTAEMTLGDISIEPWDNLIINGKRTIITEITHTFDGGLKTELSAATLSDAGTYSRTERQMQSEIAYDNYSYATGGTVEPPSVETEPERYAVDERLNASTTSGNTNLYIKDGYMAVLEIKGAETGYSNYTVEANSNIDAKYMPAYPVKIFVRGYTASVGKSDGNKTATQYEILPELDDRGKVKIVVSTALLDPKEWSLTWDRYMREDPSTSQLAYNAYYRFRVHWLLKSYVDSLKAKEETLE